MTFPQRIQQSNMSVLYVWMWVVLLLSFPQLTSQLCRKGKPAQCLNAGFAPGANLAGEGFDITKTERTGAYVLDMNQWEHEDKSCRLCRNPFEENKWQKLPLSVVDWRAKQFCSTEVSSKLYRSSEGLIRSSTSTVENNWKINLDVEKAGNSGSLMLAGTNSKLAHYSMTKTKGDKFSFASQSVTCNYYSYRVSVTPKLHEEFLKAVNELPKIYNPENKQRFYKLIEYFGTHYITKVKLGGSVKSVTSVRQCQASLMGLSSEEVEFCLGAEASVTAKVSVKAEVEHCHKDANKMEGKTSFSDLFSDRFTETKGGHTNDPDLLFSADKNPSAYKKWLDTVPMQPDIISYSLDSLHELLPVNTASRKNLRTAISHYILNKGLWRNCSSGCKAGIHSDSQDPCVCQCHNQLAVGPDCCPTRKGIARVIVMVQRASGLWGDGTTATDGFVKVFFGGQLMHRTRVILNNNNPHWGDTIDLGSQDLPTVKQVRFEVWDEDSGWDDDKLGVCEVVLTPGKKENVCVLPYGKLYYKWDVTCAPSLSGDSCTKYKPSPMSSSLGKMYVSRHATPVPKDFLLENGVFVD